jgi:hypothetical protein
MKFLVFNIVVAAALVFLMTADRGQVELAAGRAHEIAGDIRDFAERAVDQGRRLLTRGAPEPGPDVRSETIASQAPERVAAAPEPVAPKEAAAKPPPPPPEPKRLAEAAPPSPPAIVREATPPAPERTARDAAVERRRSEVLAGVPDRSASPIAEGATLMAPAERRRELLSLAEEMELLYARSISQ